METQHNRGSYIIGRSRRWYFDPSSNLPYQPKDEIDWGLRPGRLTARRLDQLEASTDEKFTVVFDAIRQLMAPPEPKKKRGIGFTARLEK